MQHYANLGHQKLVEGKFTLVEIGRAADVTKTTAVCWRTGRHVPETQQRRLALQTAFGIDPYDWTTAATPPRQEAPAPAVPGAVPTAGHRVIVDCPDAPAQAMVLAALVGSSKRKAFIPPDAAVGAYPIVVDAKSAEDSDELIAFFAEYGFTARAA